MATNNVTTVGHSSRQFRLSKDWIRYRGPFGGEGWQNIETGDVRYVQEPPGDVATEDQTQTALPGEGYELPVDLQEPKWIEHTGTVAEIIQDTLTQGRDFNPRLRITEQWREGDYGNGVDGLLEATADWIKENGDGADAARFQEALQEYDGASPWNDVEAEVPDHLDPERAESITPLRETEANAGISAGSMMIAEMETGERVYLTNTNSDIPGDFDSETDFDALAAEQSANFLDSLGQDVPEHYHAEGEFLAVAEADGTPIREYHRPRVSEGEFASFAATQMLVGNTDGHSENVFYGYDGLKSIDLDLAGTDFTEEPAEVGWALGKLFDTAVEAGIYPPYSEQSQADFLESLERELEGWASGDRAEDALEDVENEELRENFRNNIELAREGELIEEDQRIHTGL